MSFILTECSQEKRDFQHTISSDTGERRIVGEEIEYTIKFQSSGHTFDVNSLDIMREITKRLEIIDI